MQWKSVISVGIDDWRWSASRCLSAFLCAAVSWRTPVAMNKRWMWLTLGLAAGASAAQNVPQPPLSVVAAPAPSAQEALAQVLSATPIVRQVAVPQEACHHEEQAAPAETSGLGALAGTVAGGAVGHAFGKGEGRVLATLLGMLTGAFWGERAEARPAPEILLVRHCTLQSVLQAQVLGYDVHYAYGGRSYRMQWPHDPGPTLAVRVTLVDGGQPQVLPLAHVQAQTPGPHHQ